MSAEDSFRNSPLTLIGWFIIMIGLLYYTAVAPEFALFYTVMGLFGASTLFMLFFFTREQKIWEIIKFPLSNNFWKSNAFFTIGFLVFLIPSLFSNAFDILLSPKMIFSTNIWQALTVSSTPFVQTLVIGFIAPILEELMWLGVALIAFVVWAFYIDRSGKFGKIPAFMWAFLITGGSFAFFHTLNPVYEGNMFFVALVWRFVVTFLIFSFSMYEFGVGVHLGNNLGSLGLRTVAFGLLTWYGLILLGFLMLPIITAIWGFVNNKYTIGELFKSEN